MLGPNVRVVIVGSAKSVASAKAGHYYAHHSNRFWQLLRASGLTGGNALTFRDDRSVLEYGVGLTDVVPGRAESDDSKLLPEDMDLPGFIGKMEALRPVVIAFNGGASANSVSKHLGHGPTSIGFAEWTLAGAAVWRLPSSSSRNAAGGYDSKEAAWIEFGRWTQSRLEEVPQS
ncbi:MAG: mismatch-specific DNA-glycosylase [Solirubrobacterales bacterium]